MVSPSEACGIWPAVALSCFIGGILVLALLVCVNHQKVFRMFVVESGDDITPAGEKRPKAVQGVKPSRAAAAQVALVGAKAPIPSDFSVEKRLQDLTVHELAGSQQMPLTMSPIVEDMVKLTVQTQKEQERNFSQPMHSNPLTKNDDKIDLEGEANPFLRREDEVDKRRQAAKDQAQAEGLRDFQRQLQQQPADSQRQVRDPNLTRTQPGFSNLQRALAPHA